MIIPPKPLPDRPDCGRLHGEMNALASQTFRFNSDPRRFKIVEGDDANRERTHEKQGQAGPTNPAPPAMGTRLPMAPDLHRSTLTIDVVHSTAPSPPAPGESTTFENLLPSATRGHKEADYCFRRQRESRSASSNADQDHDHHPDLYQTQCRRDTRTGAPGSPASRKGQRRTPPRSWPRSSRIAR